VQSESFATDIYVSLDGRAQADGSPAVALGIEPLDTSKMGRIKDRSLRVSDGTVFVPKDYQSRQRRGSDLQARMAALAKERVWNIIWPAT
jgi:hypothetical protein